MNTFGKLIINLKDLNVEIIFMQCHTYVLLEYQILKYRFVTLRFRYKEKQIISIVHLPIPFYVA